MSLTGTLAAFALRHTLGKSADKAIDALEQHFADNSQLLPRALSRANDRAWQAVGLAVAGDTLFDRVRGWAHGGDTIALRDQLRAFLASAPTGLEASPDELRARACDELNQLRKAGRLTLKLNGSEVAADVRRFSDPSKLVAGAAEAVFSVADGLADAPHLTEVLRIAPPGGAPLLATAFLYFLRREVEGSEQLSRALTFDSLRALTATQERGFALLDSRTAGILDQFDALFDALADWFAGVSAKLDAGFAGVDAANAKLDDIQRRLLKPGVSYATEDERAFLLQAKAAFRQNAEGVSAADWAKLGDAMSTARMFGDAGEAHEAAAVTAHAAHAAHAARDSATEAANHYKAYLDACDAGAWARAFEALWKAVELEPGQYRPFDNRRYQPERILGGGAFGTVFLCRDLYDLDEEDHPRPVAIKAFRTDALDRDLQKVFAEARVLKALAHPSIIGVIDQDFDDPDTRTRPYLILEYFAGQTLDRVAPLPLPDFLAIARRVAEAVHAAHSRPRPIYHRDLKPSNVMVLRNPDGTWAVKVIDFGLAVRAAVARAGLSVPPANRSTRDRSVTGTIKYAPPEQTGELSGVEVGAYSDVYAFGKTCLDVLFRTTAPKSWDWKLLPDDVRGPLRELLERCTAESLEHRYANFVPVLAALGERERVEQANQQRLERQAEQAERLRVVPEAARLTAEQCETAVSRTTAEQHQPDVAPRRREAIRSRKLGYALYAQGDLDRAEAAYNAATKCDPTDASAYVGLGNVRSAKGDNGGALAAYERAIELDPKCAPAHVNRGNALRAKDDPDGATAAYKEAIALDPKHASAHLGLGNALYDKGDLDGARAAYTRASALDPTDAVAHNNLGNVLSDEGHFDGAITAYRKAITLDPEYARAHFNLGSSLSKKGDLDGAIAAYKRAIELDPKNVSYHYVLGLALNAAGETSGTIVAFKETIRLDPKCAPAHNDLGWTLYHRTDDVDGAIAAYREAIRLDPKWPPPHFNLGVVLGTIGDSAGAVAAFEEAIELDPTNATAHTNLGHALSDAGDLGGAVAAYRAGLVLDPTDVIAHCQLGLALYKNGDLDGAFAAYRGAIELDPKRGFAHTNLGNVLRARGDLDGARAELKEAIALDPTDTSAHYNLGLVLCDQGDLGGAIEAFKEAVTLDPTDAVAHNDLGLALYDNGDLDGAIAAYNTVIALDPADAIAHNNLGIALEDKGDLDGAITAYKEAIARDPTVVTAHNNLREACQQQAARKKAEEEATVAPALRTAGDRPAGAKLKINLPGGVAMRFAWCPPGSFQMGSNHPAATPQDDCERERPVHKVTLMKGFFMGIHPVTQAQWQAVMGTDPSHFKGANRPVECVSWDECQEFCAKLAQRSRGRVTVRLPTEAEWEYACRAGTTTEYHFGDVINPDLVNYNGNFSWNGSPKGEYRRQTTDMGSFPANPWGLYDVHGNVCEWCQDWYGRYPAKDQVDPHGRSTGSSRVVRGGDWRLGPNSCRAASRHFNLPKGRVDIIGFRVCFHFDPPSDDPSVGEEGVRNNVPVSLQLRRVLELLKSGGGAEAVEERLNKEAVVEELTRLGQMGTEELIRRVADRRGFRNVESDVRTHIVDSIHGLLFLGTLAVGENHLLMQNDTPHLPSDSPAAIARALLILRAKGNHAAADYLSSHLPPLPNATAEEIADKLNALRARGKHKEAEYLAAHLPR